VRATRPARSPRPPAPTGRESPLGLDRPLRVDGGTGLEGSAAPHRESRAARTRRRILESAARCFARNGYRRTRFEDIAAGAGVSRALVYAYFESKENLLRSVCASLLEGWREAVEPAFAREADPARALRAMIASTLHYARTRPLLTALLGDDQRLVLMSPAALSRRAIDTWRALLVDLLERGVAAGVLREGLDVEAAADVLRAMQLGLIDRMHRPGGPVTLDREAHVDAAVEILMQGLEAVPERR